MKNLWVKFGCFLTGYNYDLLSVCSEASKKSVKKYSAALIVVCLMWFFIGFTFTNRYLRGNNIESFFGGIILLIIIVQVERQIILAVHKNTWLYIFRGGIAVVMAVLGSVIIDQIIFKEDIDQAKILFLDEKISKIYPGKSFELTRQIKELDSLIYTKDQERLSFISDVSKNPFISLVEEQTTRQRGNRTIDSTGKTISAVTPTSTTQLSIRKIPNPKIGFIDQLNKQITSLHDQQEKKNNLLLNLRPSLEKDIKSSVGFLDELNIMLRLLSESWGARIIYTLWFVFLLGLELFILVSKINEDKTDYDILVIHQMETNKKKLDLIMQRTNSI